MSDSDGSPQRDNGHHRRSRSRSPVSPGYAGETLAEREEPRLVEAAVLVRQPAGHPRAAPADPEPPAQEPVPAEEAAPPFRPRPLLPHPRRRPRVHRELRPRPRESAPRHRPAPPRPAGRHGREGLVPARALSALPGAAAARAEGREGTKYRPHTQLSHTHTSPPKPYPPKAAFPQGGPWPICPPAPTVPGITLPQLQRRQDAWHVIREGGGRRAGRAGYRPRERGVRDGRRQGKCPRTNAGDRPGNTQQAARARAQATHQGQAAEEGRHTGRARVRAADNETRDTAQGKGQGHEKDTGASSSARGQTQGREQNAKAGSIGAHWAGPGAVGTRGHSRVHGQGRGKDTGVNGAGKDMGDRGQDPRYGPEGKGAGVRQCQGFGAGRRPKGKRGKGEVGPRGQAGRGVWARGDEQGVGRGTGSGAPPQPDVQPVRCIPPGIQQMPAHHAHHHHHHQAHIYKMDPDAGDLYPPPGTPISAGPPPARRRPARPRPRGTRAEGGAGADGCCPGSEVAWRGAGTAGTGAAGGAGMGSRGGPGRLGPGLGRYP